VQHRRPPPHRPQQFRADLLHNHNSHVPPLAVPYGNVPATVDELPVSFIPLVLPPPRMPRYGDVPATIDELPIVLNAQTSPPQRPSRDLAHPLVCSHSRLRFLSDICSSVSSVSCLVNLPFIWG
jgi:hypothetical protein